MVISQSIQCDECGSHRECSEITKTQIASPAGKTLTIQVCGDNWIMEENCDSMEGNRCRMCTVVRERGLGMPQERNPSWRHQEQHITRKVVIKMSHYITFFENLKKKKKGADLFNLFICLYTCFWKSLFPKKSQNMYLIKMWKTTDTVHLLVGFYSLFNLQWA